MNALRFKRSSLLVLPSCILLLLFLWWHWRLGMTRYLDVDEFAHLSWSYQMLSGRRPYVDFLFFFPPGFPVFLMPLFALGEGIAPILAGRAVAFIVFTLLVAAVTGLFWLMRRSWVAVMAGAFLAFLPMPFDKFLEIRPDTLAALLATLGMILSITNRFIFAGVAYGLSLLILPKVLPQVAVAVGVLAWQRRLAPFLLGLAAPLALFAIWALTLGDIGQVLYSIITLPVEANKISKTFIMMPDLFFYPNPTFYGEPGWGSGLLVNHAMWILAIVVGAYRLVTAPPSWREVLVAGTFFMHVLFYVQIVPLKHTQYLIPIAVFVAFYAADAVHLLWEAAGKRARTVALFLIGMTVIEYSLYRVFLLVNAPKLVWTNAETLRNLTTIYATIPASEYILDLTGETLYYRHPYRACCMPFGQWAPYLSRPLPSLSDALERTETAYIFEGGLHRTNTLLLEDQAYVRLRYLPHPTVAGLLIRK